MFPDPIIEVRARPGSSASAPIQTRKALVLLSSPGRNAVRYVTARSDSPSSNGIGLLTWFWFNIWTQSLESHRGARMASITACGHWRNSNQPKNAPNAHTRKPWGALLSSI